jgi:hypothetical protein
LQRLIDVMDSITEKSIKTLFKGHAKKQAQFTTELSDLRIEKSGGLLFKVKGGPKMVVTFVGPK